MFVAMTMSGLTKHVMPHEVPAMLALGWTPVVTVPVKKAAPKRKSK